MKVTLKHRIAAYRGECDDLVYYRNRRTGDLMARRYVKPAYSSSNRKLGEGVRHLNSLAPSPLFIKDLKIYIELYNSLRDPDDGLLNNSRALYVKLIYAQARALGIEVNELNRELISNQQLPCRSVKSAVDAGLMTTVEGYERLTNEL